MRHGQILVPKALTDLNEFGIENLNKLLVNVRYVMIALIHGPGDAKKFNLEDLYRQQSYPQLHDITFEETLVHQTLALVSH